MGEKRSFPALRNPLDKRRDSRPYKNVTQHTYLKVGDKVFHRKFRSWGRGMVLEARSSEVPGGLCYVRILFQDGKSRVFDNSYDSTSCCYYTGITLLDRVEV
jgi:hypothetical protein